MYEVQSRVDAFQRYGVAHAESPLKLEDLANQKNKEQNNKNKTENW